MKYFEYKDFYFAESVAQSVCSKHNITLADCTELVRCTDGVLRDVNTVTQSDVWVDAIRPEDSDLID